jgi:hypothetical protein
MLLSKRSEAPCASRGQNRVRVLVEALGWAWRYLDGLWIAVHDVRLPICETRADSELSSTSSGRTELMVRSDRGCRPERAHIRP